MRYEPLFARQHNAKRKNRDEYLLFIVPEQIRWLNSNDLELLLFLVSGGDVVSYRINHGNCTLRRIRA